MGTKLPEREVEIGKRLRAVREFIGVSRTKFALQVGIGSERLASYESGRAPVRYEVFKAITNRFFLRPTWLAEGKGVPLDDEPFDEREFAMEINPKALFSVVYDTVLSGLLNTEAAAAQRQAAKVLVSMKQLLETLLKETPSPEDIALAEKIHPVLEALIAKIEPLRLQREIFDKIIARQQGDEQHSDDSKNKSLQSDYAIRNNAGMQSPLRALMGRVACVTSERGKKAELAALLKVPPPRVSEWLHGKGEPTGESVLRLLAWVTAEEAKQNAPGSATNTTRSKTRSTHSTYETKKTSPRKE